MSKIFLITRPNHEHRVNYLHSWSKDIIKFAEDNNIAYSDFEGKKVNKDDVEKYIVKRNPQFIIFNGHGAHDTILGYDDQPLIELGKNSNLLKDKIVYSRSCFTTTKLGKHAVNVDGTKCFIGYAQPFTWVHAPEREGVPDKDKLCVPFKQISNEIPISILKGHTTLEAHERSKKLCTKLINEYASSESEDSHKAIRFWLFWDMVHQELIGDQTATF